MGWSDSVDERVGELEKKIHWLVAKVCKDWVGKQVTVPRRYHYGRGHQPEYVGVVTEVLDDGSVRVENSVTGKLEYEDIFTLEVES